MEGLLNQLVLEHLQLAPLQWGEYPPIPLGLHAPFPWVTLSARWLAVASLRLA